MGPADWIAAQAAANEATVVARDRGTLWVDVRLRRTDGRVVPFRLRIEAPQPVVTVREDPAKRLPTECYERHITPGGWFCMNWHTADPLEVRDPESAGRWWATLLGYLRRQERAAKSGRWPGKAWAHGKAAQAQWDAERAAQGLGRAYADALAEGRMTVTSGRGRSGTDFLELRIDGRKGWSVWKTAGRVATLRQACLCGRSRRALADCGEHASQAAVLVLALVRWRAEEERFWRSNKGSSCCGTIKTCPLRVPKPSNDPTGAQGVTSRAAA